jgi:carboxymethylenebutenolidase
MRIHTEIPDGVAEAPGVVVIMHGPGLDRFVEDRVRALARAGYAAVAPDLYHRQPADGAEPADMAAIMARIGKLRDDEILADLDAAVAHLRGLSRPRVTGLAVLGFCMGGRITYLAAGARPGTWRAAGVFYGGNIMKAWGDGPAPLERTPRIDCPVIGFFGEDDTNPSPADVDRIDAELTAHGKPHDFHRYAGAGHAFLNFTNAERHRPEQAADAWQKLMAFLDRHLKA